MYLRPVYCRPFLYLVFDDRRLPTVYLLTILCYLPNAYLSTADLSTYLLLIMQYLSTADLPTICLSSCSFVFANLLSTADLSTADLSAHLCPMTTADLSFYYFVSANCLPVYRRPVHLCSLTTADLSFYYFVVFLLLCICQLPTTDLSTYVH